MPIIPHITKTDPEPKVREAQWAAHHLTQGHLDF
jgi:hypothetical protein